MPDVETQRWRRVNAEIWLPPTPFTAPYRSMWLPALCTLRSRQVEACQRYLGSAHMD